MKVNSRKRRKVLVSRQTKGLMIGKEGERVSGDRNVPAGEFK